MTPAPKLHHNKNMTTKQKILAAAASKVWTKATLEPMVRGSSKKGGK